MNKGRESLSQNEWVEKLWGINSDAEWNLINTPIATELLTLWRHHLRGWQPTGCIRCNTSNWDHRCELCECPLCSAPVNDTSPFRCSSPIHVATETNKVDKLEAGILVEKYW